ncbi:phosrestin-2-like [Episyrphus balteatus]|uniref:phosrestin-2-like n=1 Tax=Episyrphus balteatus TaxID=286459 RepID=UPI0024855550|nr:phosrestin-2-like [Episyrphus balteatus]XP_055849118.1 phosrestin-2-like [Episyrphus balteatus]
MDQIANAKVYKKTSSNSILTLYMGSRDLISTDGVVEPLRGVIVVDPKYLASQKIYGQLTLTFRYGREDEEVMGLKFCNELVVALKQLWPRINYTGEMTVLQQALVDRLGAGAHPFQIDVGTIAAPSVQLLPAKKYSGDPIGTSYDVRIFMSDLADEKLQGRTTVKLGIRVIYKIPTNFQSIQESNLSWKSSQNKQSFRTRLSPKIQRLCSRSKQQEETSKSTTAINNSEAVKKSNVNNAEERLKSDFFKGGEEGPESCTEKLFLWTEGNVSLKSSLDKCAYKHGEAVCVKVHIRNSSRKVVRKIRIVAVQHVDVCMFSNGKFKNIVGEIVDSNHIKSNDTFSNTYKIMPTIGSTKNWIAVESKLPHAHVTTDFLSTNNYKLASSTFQDNIMKERNVFAIYVTYYIKIKLTLSALGGDLSLKLPFVLGYVGEDVHHASSTRRNSEKLLDVLVSRKIPLNRINTTKVNKENKVSENTTSLNVPNAPPEANETQEEDASQTQQTSPNSTSIKVEIHREN